MTLVVVESPAKVKSIEKYLGKGFTVKASKGHVVDLPKSDLGVDLTNQFEPTYVVTKADSIRMLKQAFSGKETLIIATDPDREGEAIGWHVARELGVITDKGNLKRGKKLQRIVFTSITKDAVQEAIKLPRSLDKHLFDAQQARRVLDRLVGYKLSPLLWKKIQFGLSAGRVQSVALRLVVEREEEREVFIAEEYWTVTAGVMTKSSKLEPKVNILLQEAVSSDKSQVTDPSPVTRHPSLISFELSKINGKKTELTSQKEVEPILAAVKDKPWIISDISSKEVKRYPKPPFTTSTLQQTAANWFGFSAKRTMKLAQDLYEQGHITYMRTDSTNLSPGSVMAARDIIKKQLGPEYIPEKPIFYQTKAKVAQEAHEAIRPADPAKHPNSMALETEHLKLYRLIWQRFMACQMVPARVEKGRIEINIKTQEHKNTRTQENKESTRAQIPSREGQAEGRGVSTTYLFSATGQKMLFPGYRAIYPEKFEEQELPQLNIGQTVYLHHLLAAQHFTQPPARYSEATLIKALETFGIGRPSTYVPTLSTIQNRQYVIKDNGYFAPTDIGRAVTHLLKDHFPEVVDYEFTANMENDLDNIANGDKDWVKMMKEFYGPFEKQLKGKDKVIDREMYKVLGDAPKKIKCPDCGASMKIKLGRFGRFYSCSKWPACKGIMGEDGKSEKDRDKERAMLLKSDAFQNLYLPAPKTEDGRDFLLKEGRYGKFWAHPDYPKVKDARPLELQSKIKTKIYGSAPKTGDGQVMVLRRGRFGDFWAHPNYPEVKEVVRVNKKKVEEKKRELGITN